MELSEKVKVLEEEKLALQKVILAAYEKMLQPGNYYLLEAEDIIGDTLEECIDDLIDKNKNLVKKTREMQENIKDAYREADAIVMPRIQLDGSELSRLVKELKIRADLQHERVESIERKWKDSDTFALRQRADKACAENAKLQQAILDAMDILQPSFSWKDGNLKAGTVNGVALLRAAEQVRSSLDHAHKNITNAHNELTGQCCANVVESNSAVKYHSLVYLIRKYKDTFRDKVNELLDDHTRGL